MCVFSLSPLQMMNMMYGFHAEAVAKYGQDLAVRFRHLFCHLPLGACLNHKVLVMHGGLFSHDDVTLADINAVDRVREPPDDGLMAELLWSDPMPEAGRAPNVRGIGVRRPASRLSPGTAGARERARGGEGGAKERRRWCCSLGEEPGRVIVAGSAGVCKASDATVPTGIVGRFLSKWLLRVQLYWGGWFSGPCTLAALCRVDGE